MPEACPRKMNRRALERAGEKLREVPGTLNIALVDVDGTKGGIEVARDRQRSPVEGDGPSVVAQKRHTYGVR